MPYGLKVQDAVGNIIQIRPEVSAIVDAGRSIVPTNLRPDDTFGINIKLPGLSNFDEDSIGVIANVQEWAITTSYMWVGGGLTPEEWGLFKWLPTAVTYHEHNLADGSMSVFTAEAAKDTILNMHGIAFWDKMGNTEFDTIRVFACLLFYIYDRSASSYKKVYAIGFVDEVDFVVSAKNIKVE